MSNVPLNNTPLRSPIPWNSFLSLFIAALFATGQGCAAALDRGALEEQLLEADRAFSDASVSDGPAAAFADFLATDAVGLPNEGPILRGRDVVANFLAADSTLRITWKPESALLSEKGDLGFTWGRLIATFPGPSGGDIAATGKYMTVWRRESSGRWRVVGYMNNRSPSFE